ncbi:MAG TPA: DUF2231 domain-containing protein [Pseudonocardiaceae bacterium]|jgi:hypothetical protein|nr:DUF2231 domain-containing protein [Pseudonocardiaceae bacterium]
MVLAQDLVTIAGLPAHPLLVHAVVVLLPLAAVGVVTIAVRPAWRRRYGPVVAGLTVLGVAVVPFAQQAGEQLAARLARVGNPLIVQHTALGRTLLPYSVVFAALTLALVLTGRWADRAVSDRHRAWRVLVAVVAVLAVGSAAVTTAQVVRIGHSGSKAVWDGVSTLP